jgi:hypothetical protein
LPGGPQIGVLGSGPTATEPVRIEVILSGSERSSIVEESQPSEFQFEIEQVFLVEKGTAI